MKKFVSFICLVAMLCTVVAPLSQTVSAADAPWYDKWRISGPVTINEEEGTVKISNTGNIIMGYSHPAQYTISFSMNVIVWSMSLGLQGSFSDGRSGVYVRNGIVTSMDIPDYLNVSNSSGWHDYKLEVDHKSLTQKVYFDGVYVGTQNLKTFQWADNTLKFWAESGGEFEIADFSIVSGIEGMEGGELFELTQEYTEPFFEDFDDISGWSVPDEKYFTHDKENGIVKIYREKITGIPTYVERPLRPPTNYDMEWYLKLTDIKALNDQLNQGSIHIQLSTDSRHTWVSFGMNSISIRSHGDYGSDPFSEDPQVSVPYRIAYDKWFHLKAEVRDRYITWYIDGEELVTYEIYRASNNIWHVETGANPGGLNLSMGMELDWQKYTPYFDDELKVTAPLANSKFAAGGDIELKAETKLDTEKVDYYINGVYVGSGYKENNYVYVLKNAKNGVYRVTAKASGIETCENKFTVYTSFEAELSLNKKEVSFGEKVVATAGIKALVKTDKPTKVEFFANGKLHSTDTSAPFQATFTDLQVGTGNIYAKVYNTAGAVVQTEPQYVSVDYVKGKALKIGREYEVDYDYTSANGSFELNDGYFTLSMKHTADGVTYKTDEGEKSYKGIGKGDYKIIVSAGHAEIYWKGQFLESILLPYEPKNVFTKDSGLSNVKIKGSGVKAELFSMEWKGEAEYVSDALPSTKYYSFEFDKTDSSPEEIYINDSTFYTTLSFREDGIYAIRQRKTGADPTEVKLSDEVKPGYYRLTVAFGMADLSVNNKMVGQFRCVLGGSKAYIKRTMSNPKASTIIAFKGSDDIYYHSENFEEETELSYEEYWQLKPITYKSGLTYKAENTLKEDAKGNHYMNVSGNGTYLLNVISQYPSLKWRGMADKASGKVFVTLRRTFADRQNRIGYDFDTQSWYFEIETTNKVIIEKDSKPAPDAIKPGKWYDFELIAEGYEVALFMDGKEVFRTELDYDLRTIYYGRMGIGVDGSSYNFDDFEYVGENRVTPGARTFVASEFCDTSVNDSVNRASVDIGMFYELDGTVYAGGTAGMKTTDGGKTWIQAPGESKVQSSQFVKMKDGTFVTVTKGSDGVWYANLSKNNGISWDSYFIQSGEYGRIGTNGRLTCSKDGRLFVAFATGDENFGRQDVMYSDDGKKWYHSESTIEGQVNTVNTYTSEVIMNEIMVVETPRENEVWACARSDSGYIVYFVSYDNGATFDPEPHPIGLMAPETAYRIMRDDEDPYTYYAIFLYDTKTADVYYEQYPRNRIALAVSHDGMENWEFVADLMEANNIPSLITSDSVAWLIDGNIYWKTNNYDRNGVMTFGVQSVDTMKTLKRMPQAHYRQYMGYDPVATTAQRHCVVSKTNKTAWIYGDYYAADVKDGRIDIETVERVFGVVAEKSGNTITLKFGDGKVTFTEGKDTVQVNGETVTAERAAQANGYLDIKTLSEIFDKVFRETDSSYCILDRAQSVEPYQSGFDKLA
ncbi:MAG: exo-alpha-sialidase [Clostridia bacterium]|nr:exo-alpha-sialidase [Clostridia bacterium]